MRINFFNKKVKGGALQYTLVFALLIMMSLTLYLLYVRLSATEVYSVQKQTQLIENINSSVVLLENQPQMFYTSDRKVWFSDDTTFVTDLKLSRWGFYDYAKIVASQGKRKLSKIYLFADNIADRSQLPSLYLSAADQFLSVGGKTYLGNNTFLPKYGIRKSYVAGIGYYRDSLIQGKSFKATQALPALSKIWAQRYLDLKALTEEISENNDENELKKDSVSVSFNDAPLILKCPEDYFLDNKYLKGNIVLTGHKITVLSTSQIHHCIILADTIIVENHFKGDAQLIADDFIEIGDSSAFSIPSIFYLSNPDRKGMIKIKSNTKFQGQIIIPQRITERKESLIIEEGCDMVGQIYCNGYSSFKGTLFGSFYTSGFMLNNGHGQFENYLVDVCIDGSKLPEEFFGISMIEKSNKKKCVEELD